MTDQIRSIDPYPQGVVDAVDLGVEPDQMLDEIMSQIDPGAIDLRSRRSRPWLAPVAAAASVAALVVGAAWWSATGPGELAPQYGDSPAAPSDSELERGADPGSERSVLPSDVRTARSCPHGMIVDVEQNRDAVLCAGKEPPPGEGDCGRPDMPRAFVVTAEGWTYADTCGLGLRFVGPDRQTFSLGWIVLASPDIWSYDKYGVRGERYEVLGREARVVRYGGTGPHAGRHAALTAVTADEGQGALPANLFVESTMTDPGQFRRVLDSLREVSRSEFHALIRR